jgi:hypothetical protein
MKLHVIGTVGTVYAFGLRHFPAFYPLVVLAGVPQYIYSQVPCPEWEARFVAAGAEMLVSGAFVALMAATLKRDRRGESRTVLPSIGDTLARSPTVLGVTILMAIYIVGLLFVGDALNTLHPQAPIAVLAVHFIVFAFLCMAVPCAAVETRGVLDCFRRSVKLSAGSRLRILATYFLALVPLAIAWTALVVFGTDLPIEGLWEILFFFGLPAFSVFPFAFPAVVHASLITPKDDVSFATPEAVFD